MDTKRKIGDYEIEHSVWLNGGEIAVAIDLSAEMPYIVCDGERNNFVGAMLYDNIAESTDYLAIMREFSERVLNAITTLEIERDARNLPQQILTAADCISGGLDENLEGKVVVIKPDALSPEFCSADRQLKIVLSGFGCDPNSRGSAVFCRDVYSGAESRFERYDIAGVIAPDKLPDWAVEKLTESRESEKHISVLEAIREAKSKPPTEHKAKNHNKSEPEL